MKISLWKIQDIVPYENNPRVNDNAVEAVVKSIQEFGFQQPIVVDKHGVIVAGHTRLKAAQAMGLKKCPVHVAENLTEQQIKAYRLADNRVGELATWDKSKLAVEVQELSDIGFDLDVTGFELKDIEPPDFEPGTEDDQGRLDQLEPKIETCPECGLTFDLREHEQG
jgi:site-specific DNA-methyltransferase (adenine-specific)